MHFEADETRTPIGSGGTRDEVGSTQDEDLCTISYAYFEEHIPLVVNCCTKFSSQARHSTSMCCRRLLWVTVILSSYRSALMIYQT